MLDVFTYDFLIVAGITPLLAMFFLLVLLEIKFIEYLQARGNWFFKKLSNCGFCLSIWANWIVILALLPFSLNLWTLLIPLFTVPITVKMLQR